MHQETAPRQKKRVSFSSQTLTESAENLKMSASIEENAATLDNYEKFEIVWNKMSYSVKSSKGEVRQVLHAVSGTIRSRQLHAIMGPSGAGKSTLIECVIGKRNEGRSGDVMFRGDVEPERVKIAFIPQHDVFIPVLTVRECIVFASKLQNAIKHLNGTLDAVEDAHGNVYRTPDAKYHSAVADSLILQLGLETCADNRVANCSGGQMKRLSIAQELVACPSIVILDEPTTGLDSASCLQVVEMLSNLTLRSEHPIAIVMTIHQPSIKVFNLFQMVYVISLQGKCIYERQPQDLVNYLSELGMQMPKAYSPADFLIEIANGDYGEQILDALVKRHERDFETSLADLKDSNVQKRTIAEVRAKELRQPFAKHTWYHAQRCMLLTVRDPLVFAARFVASFVIAAFISLMFGPAGISGGCPPKIDGDFEPADLDAAVEHIKTQLGDTYNNSGQQFFCVLFLMFSAIMPTVMSFPAEMQIMVKERNNGWYGTLAYYSGKFLAELPFQLILPLIFSEVVWFLSPQATDQSWRFYNYVAITIIVTLIAQTMGTMIGTLYMDNLAVSIFLGPMSFVPFMLFSGAFIKMSAMPFWIRWPCWISYTKYGMDAIMLTLYGFGRCGADAPQKLIAAREALIVWLGAMLGTFDEEITTVAGENETEIEEGKASVQFVEGIVQNLAGRFITQDGTVQSSVLVYMDLYDSDLINCWMILFVILVIKRFIAYRMIVWQADKRK